MKTSLVSLKASNENPVLAYLFNSKHIIVPRTACECALHKLLLFSASDKM